MTQVRFYNQGAELQVVVAGRVATASGPRIHSGNVWTINLLAIKGQPSHNQAIIRVAQPSAPPGQLTFSAVFSGSSGLYVSVK